MSMPECLVVMGVFTLLFAFGLPAIQQAREAGRRLQCANHMRQLGVGVASYAALHGVYPTPCGVPNYSGTIESFYPKQYSLFTQILPFLDQQPIFDAINFECSVSDPYLRDRPRPGFASNRSVMQLTFAMFVCPSDSSAGSAGWSGNVNYRANLGVDALYRQAFSDQGPFSIHKRAGPHSVTDGHSNTAAFSERLCGSLSHQPYDAVRHILTPRYLAGDYRTTFKHCKYQDIRKVSAYKQVGFSWVIGSLSQTCYNHALTPNSEEPDCILPATDPVIGHVSARSLHGSGANVGLLDGSVRVVTNSINVGVWQALGTQAGGEVVELPW